MADLIGIGLTGLKTHQIGLSVTGNNVANINTPGYSRQEAIFVDTQAELTGGGYLGQGSSVETIRRITQSFVVEQQRADTTVFFERNAMLSQASIIDNLLASEATGLTPSLSRFFEAFQGAADNPTSIPQRQLLLTQTEGLVTRFQTLDARLKGQVTNINQQLEADISEINALSQGLAEANTAISLASSTGAAGQTPNQLLDERDETLRKLSELVALRVVENSDGRVNVFFGKGEPLVVGDQATRLETIRNPSDGSITDVGIVLNGTVQNITQNISGGSVGGALQFRENELSEVINALGRIALTISETVNDQHGLGMDLENKLGGLFFGDVNDQIIATNRVLASSNNLPPDDQSLRVNIINSSELTIDNYELRFEGPSNSDFVIYRQGTRDIAFKSTLSNVFPTSIELDGFEIQFDGGTFKVGDTFTLYPTRNGATDITQVVDRVEEIALAAPIRAKANLGNLGNAQITFGEMLDVSSPLTNQTLDTFSVDGELNPPLAIRFISDDYYEVLDVSDPANPQPLVPPLNNQRFAQGLSNEIFNADPGANIVIAQGSDTQVVPTPSAGPFLNGYGAQNLTVQSRDLETNVVTAQTVSISADSSAKQIAEQMTSVQGIEANAYTQVRVSNFFDDGDPTPLGITVNGEAITLPPLTAFSPVELASVINANTNLQNLNIVAVSDGVNLDIRAFTGEDIVVEITGVGDSADVSKLDPYSPGTPVLSTQTVNAGQGVAVGGNVDVTLANGINFTADTSTVFDLAPVAQSAYLGFQFEIQGETRKGDEFTIEYNTDGVSDNRNALAIGALEAAGLIAGGVASYGESYSQIVEEIGTVTNRTRLETDSAKALLQQTTQYRDSISAVNLDEEAGKLIQYQAAYNASAQVVSVARELFDTLLGAFR